MTQDIEDAAEAGAKGLAAMTGVMAALHDWVAAVRTQHMGTTRDKGDALLTAVDDVLALLKEKGDA